jgi:7-carboxy-7-deazaguanine synthase
MTQCKVSEIFSSMQGEGKFTGIPSLWVRFFGCNLQCDGFGQSDPTDPSTYVLPYKTFDLTHIKTMDDLPVFDKGCDSGYSWSSRFKKLAPVMTTDAIVDRLITLGKNELGIDILNDGWTHPMTQVSTQVCFTGGEPMLQQKAIMAICERFKELDVVPAQITIETNATQSIKETVSLMLLTNHLHFSCSPKLFTTSGESAAIHPDVLSEYVSYSDSGILKFVVNGSQQTWDELDEVMLRLGPVIREDPDWSVWIMPANSTVETLQPDYTSNIAREGLRRGYAVSMRTHVYAFGNCMGS